MFRPIIFLGKKVTQRQMKSIERVSLPFCRNFSTLLDAKEKAAENIYIRNLEATKLAELRAKFEKIITEPATTSDKEDILSILEPKPKDDGIISKLGLDDWRFALPIGMILAIPAVANEVIVLNAETQLLAVFILALSTLYTQGGGMIGKALDNYADEIHKELKSVDDAILEDSKSWIEENKKLFALEQDYKNLYQLVDDLNVAQADILNYSAEHKYKEAIIKKLDSLVAIEETTTSAIRNRMVNAITSDVISKFRSDKKAKEEALEQAINVLAAGSSGKLGKDVVGNAFTSSIKNYRDNYSKKSPDSDDLLVNLQKEISNIAVPPVIDGLGSGGNVYVTHPIIGGK